MVRLSNVVGHLGGRTRQFHGMISQQALNGKICFELSILPRLCWLDDVLDLLVDIPIKAARKFTILQADRI